MLQSIDLKSQYRLQIHQNRIWFINNIGARMLSLSEFQEDIEYEETLKIKLEIQMNEDSGYNYKYNYLVINQISYYKDYILAAVSINGDNQIRIWDISTNKLLWEIPGKAEFSLYPTPYGLYFTTNNGPFVIVLPREKIKNSKESAPITMGIPNGYHAIRCRNNDGSEIPWRETSFYKKFPLDRYLLPGDRQISTIYWFGERLYLFDDQGDVFRIVPEFTIEKVIHIGRTTLSPLLFEGPYVVYIDDYNEVAVFDLQTEKFIQKYQPHKTAIKGRYLSRGILVTAARDDPQIKFTDILTGECVFEYQVNEKEFPVCDEVIESLCWNATTLYGMIYTYLVKWDLPPEVAELKGQGFKEEYDNK